MSEELTRRRFLTGVGASAVGVAALGCSVSGNITKAEGAETTPGAAFIEGSYTSTQHTPYATVDVTCTFSADALTDVSYNVTKTSVSDYFPAFESMLKDMCTAIVENGKADGVDAVSGATHCSTALKEGVNDCTLQALGITLSENLKGRLNPQVDDYTSFDTDCVDAFSPIKLGTMEISNRFVKSAGSAPWEDSNGSRVPVCEELFGAMAENGVALNVFAGGVLSGTGIMPDSLDDFEGTIDEALATITPLIDRIHAAGGKCGYQIFWGGGFPVIGADVVNNATVEELDQFIEDVATSVQRAKQVGIDCVEIKGASADGLNGFFSRRINNRTDEYGSQSIENRTRLFCRMIQKIKEVNGEDYPVGALINGCEENDESLGDNDLYTTIAEGQEMAKALVAAGADWIQVRVGCTGEDSEMNMWAPDVAHCLHNADGLTGYGEMFDYSEHFGGNVDGSRSGFASFLPVVKAIKEVVDVPVGCAAYMDFRVGPDFLNDAIKNGELDLIFMNRPLNCDPELVRKMQEGRRDLVRPCMKCMHCHDGIGSNHKYESTCRMNATTEHSLTDVMPEGMVPPAAETPRNVMVIGAGPAGIETAIVAAERGHTVDIYDKEYRLGGLMHFARGVKGDHEHFEDYFAYAQAQLNELGVNVHLSTEVDEETVKEANPDVVVVAVGGTRADAYVPNGALDPETAFGSQNLGEKVAIIGGNVQAVDFAAYLVTEGKKVVIVNPGTSDELAHGQSGWFTRYIVPHMRAKGTKIWNGATVNSVSTTEVSFTTEYGIDETVTCDSVIDLSDLVPNTELADALMAAGYEVHSVGDCVDPWNIQRAVYSGNLLARSL